MKSSRANSNTIGAALVLLGAVAIQSGCLRKKTIADAQSAEGQSAEGQSAEGQSAANEPAEKSEESELLVVEPSDVPSGVFLACLRCWCADPSPDRRRSG
jgi:hypothetical protein